MEILFSAFVLGLMGSFHCVGMCGPIALSLPLRGTGFLQKFTGGALYNLGRTLGYGVMGGVFGFIGQGFQMLGFQRWVSIGMGMLMVASILIPVWYTRKKTGNPNAIFVFVRRSIQQLFKDRSYGSLFLIGILNSLLPCGLVYLAIAGAIGMGNTIYGAFYMVLFGLGTIPMMLAVSFLGNVISLTARNKLNKIIPYIVVLIGIIFIFRGLCLGIPYLSPPLEKLTPGIHMKAMESKGSSNAVEESCCKKK